MVRIALLSVTHHALQIFAQFLPHRAHVQVVTFSRSTRAITAWMRRPGQVLQPVLAGRRLLEFGVLRLIWSNGSG